MPTATMTTKGQVTIPKDIRERLGIGAGDRLEFTLDETGQVIVRPDAPTGICGILRDFAPSEPVSVESMNRAIKKRAAEAHARSSR